MPRSTCGILTYLRSIPWAVTSGPYLPGAAHAVVERSQLLDADRSASMHLACCNADFCAHSELATIGELCGRVVQQDGGIDFVEEPLDNRGILGDHRFGVVGGISADVI